MSAIMLYDGDCALCSGAVAFTLRHERTATIAFASTRSPEGQAIGAAHGLDLAALDATFAFVEDGRAYLRSAGVLRLVAHLRAPWSWLRVARAVPLPLRDAVYSFVASNRVRFGPSACVVPPPGMDSRFIGGAARRA